MKGFGPSGLVDRLWTRAASTGTHQTVRRNKIQQSSPNKLKDRTQPPNNCPPSHPPTPPPNNPLSHPATHAATHLATHPTTTNQRPRQPTTQPPSHLASQQPRQPTANHSATQQPIQAFIIPTTEPPNNPASPINNFAAQPSSHRSAQQDHPAPSRLAKHVKQQPTPLNRPTIQAPAQRAIQTKHDT